MKTGVSILLGLVCLAAGFAGGLLAKDLPIISSLLPSSSSTTPEQDETVPPLEAYLVESTDEQIVADLEPLDLATLSETYRVSEVEPETVAEEAPEPEAEVIEEAPAETVPDAVAVTDTSSSSLVPTEMAVCPTSVSNAPDMDSDRKIVGYKPAVQVEGVPILLAPVTRSCLSSGYGPRGSSGRLHKGLDYYTRQNGDVLAAGNGIIVEASFRDDYGNMLVLDHGSGVYTRYAHLASIAPGIDVGKEVTTGTVLGPIGATGSYTSVVHLHYEVMTGDYNTPKKSFGLATVDIMKLR